MIKKGIAHITMGAINMFLVAMVETECYLIIDKFLQPMFKIAGPEYYSFIYKITFLVLSWLAPIMIWQRIKFVKQLKVLFATYAFIIVGSVVHAVITVRDYMGDYNGLFDYVLHMIKRVCFTEYILVMAVLYSLVIVGSQWLLTKLYQRFNFIQLNNCTS